MELKKGDFIHKGASRFEVVKTNKKVTLRSEDGWKVTVGLKTIEKTGYVKDEREGDKR